MSISKSKNVLFLVIMFSLLFQSAAFACSLCGSTEAKAEAIGLKTINEAVKSNPNTVIAFHSNSCGTCKVQKPKLQALLLKEKYSPIKDIFLDFDSEEEVRKKLKVNYPSTIIIFKNGSEVARVTGETNEDALQKLLDKGLL